MRLKWFVNLILVKFKRQYTLNHDQKPPHSFVLTELLYFWTRHIHLYFAVNRTKTTSLFHHLHNYLAVFCFVKIRDLERTPNVHKMFLAWALTTRFKTTTTISSNQCHFLNFICTMIRKQYLANRQWRSNFALAGHFEVPSCRSWHSFQEPCELS